MLEAGSLTSAKQSRRQETETGTYDLTVNYKVRLKMSDLVGFDLPKMDWSPRPDLHTRFKRFRQKCELLLDGPLKSRDSTQKCKYVLLWLSDHSLDLFNMWVLTTERPEGILDKI